MVQRVYACLFTPRGALLILLLGVAALRSYWLAMGLGAGHFSFHDELQAYQFAEQLRYYSHARIGKSFLPGPWQNVLVALAIKSFNFVRPELLGLYIFPLLGGLASSLALYLALRRWSGDARVGLCGAFLMGVSPWGLQFSYTFWNPYPVILLMTLALYCLHDVIHTPRSKELFPLIFLSAIMPFFHMMAIFASLGMFVLLVYQRKTLRLHIPLLSAGGICALFFYVPFVIFDAQNNFQIIRAYFQSDVTAWKAEALKVISNHLIALSHEVSRLVGYNWRSYAAFLERYYGSYWLALLFMVPSFLLALSAWYRFLRCVWQQAGGTERKLFIYTAVTLGSFLLTLQAHELRYLNVTWCILVYVLATGIISWWDVQQKLAPVKRLVLRLLAVIYVGNTIYLALILPHYFRYPHVGTDYRLIPSLLFFEQVETAIVYNAETLNARGTLPAPLSGRETLTTADVWQESLWSLVTTDAARERLVQRRVNIPLPRLKIYFPPEFLETSLYAFKERQILENLSIFINFRNRLAVVPTAEAADAQVVFVTRERWQQQLLNPDLALSGYQFLAEVYNGFMVAKLVP